LRFRVCPIYIPNSENEFIDIETFSNDVLEVRETQVDSATGTEAEAGCSRDPITNDVASLKFAEELECTVMKDDDPVENPLLIEHREEIPEDQDPSPSITTYNESFGTSFRGELLSVGGEVISADGDALEFSLLWKSPKSWVKQEEVLQRRSFD
jgi:hypothetical protein